MVPVHETYCHGLLSLSRYENTDQVLLILQSIQPKMLVSSMQPFSCPCKKTGIVCNDIFCNGRLSQGLANAEVPDVEQQGEPSLVMPHNSAHEHAMSSYAQMHSHLHAGHALELHMFMIC